MAVDWSQHLSPLERMKRNAERSMGRRESARFNMDAALQSLQRKANAVARREAFTVIRGGADRPEGYLSRQNL